MIAGGMEASRTKPGIGSAEGSALARQTNSGQETIGCPETGSVPTEGQTREGARMPRELTRQFVPADITAANPDYLQIRVSQTERTVRVSLSGTLDRAGVAKLSMRVTPRLASRGAGGVQPDQGVLRA